MRQSDTEIIPEVQLLLCSVSDEHDRARMEHILRGRVDWLRLLRLANENGVLPLLCGQLRQTSNLIRPETTAQFSDANRKNTIRGLLLTAELLRITECLCRRNIAALCYKGPVLGQLAYADPLLRQFSDLDFVVRQESMAGVYDEMESLGYRARFPRDRFVASAGKEIPGEYVFVHKVNGAMVEWHTAQTLRHFPRPPDLDAMISRSVMVSIDKRQIATFAPADTMLMLCVHGAKDFWSRLIWVADVAALAAKLSDADWGRLFAEGRKYDAERMVILGLWLAHTILECPLPAAVLRKVEADRVVEKTGNELRGQLLYTKELPAGVAWRSLYRIKMVHPIWKGARYWLRLSTAPAEEDWSANQRAAGVRARYAFLRPMRLWRKYRHSVREELGDKAD